MSEANMTRECDKCSQSDLTRGEARVGNDYLSDVLNSHFIASQASAIYSKYRSIKMKLIL